MAALISATAWAAGVDTGDAPQVEADAPGVRAPLPALPRGPAQVEGLDDRGAWLLPLDGSPGVMVRRDQLPADVKEGDVVRGGKVDRQATAQLRAWISEKLQEIDRAGRPIPLGHPPLTYR